MGAPILSSPPRFLPAHGGALIPRFDSWPPTNPEVAPARPAQAPQPAENPWRDVEGTHIPLQCQVEQIAVNKDHGALPSRLHQHGEVIGRGTDLLYVRFQGENQLVGLRPHLVRVFTTPDDR